MRRPSGESATSNLVPLEGSSRRLRMRLCRLELACVAEAVYADPACADTPGHGQLLPGPACTPDAMKTATMTNQRGANSAVHIDTDLSCHCCRMTESSPG